MSIKKAITCTVGLALGVFSIASAIEMSAGASVFFSNSFDGGNKSDLIYEHIKDRWMGGGFNIFFDAAYAELGVGITFGGNVWETLIRETFMGDDDYDDDCYDSGWYTDFSTSKAINISLLGKYPYSLNENIYLFPMAGIDYYLLLSEKGRGINIEYIGSPNRIWLKFGGGMDYSITGKIYIRHTLLYGIGFSSKAERKAREWFYDDDDVYFTHYHGFTFKVGVGYKF
jgi:opacity protein-like surface antigen